MYVQVMSCLVGHGPFDISSTKILGTMPNSNLSLIISSRRGDQSFLKKQGIKQTDNCLKMGDKDPLQTMLS